MIALSILHANSNALVRAGLRSVLNQGGGIELIDEATNEDQLVSKLSQRSYDIIVIDYDQEGHFSVDTIRQLVSTKPGSRILVITSDPQERRIFDVLEAGIFGYITRECEKDEIINAVFAIANGEKFYCNKVINVILEKTLGSKPEPEDCNATILTERESEIIGLIARGMTNKLIATTLFLSQHTVNTHRKNIMKKLRVNSTSGLVLYAVNAGLVGPGQVS